MRFRGGEFSTGTMGNFQPELTLTLCTAYFVTRKRSRLHAMRLVPCSLSCRATSFPFRLHPNAQNIHSSVYIVRVNTVHSERLTVIPVVTDRDYGSYK
jgi:hypothetical protein